MKSLKKRWFLIVSALAYIVIIGGIVARHSVWQDEAQAWLIARDMPFFSMFSLAGYEGNGMLWHILIYPLAHLGLPVMSMQILDAGFAVAAVYLLFRYAPFPSIMRAGIVFGYFFLFEYSTIARNYSISVFLIFLVAALYRTRFERPLRFFVLLALLSLTNIHSLIISGIIAAVFAWEAWHRRSEIDQKLTLQGIVFFALICVTQFCMLFPQPANLWHYTADTNVDVTYEHIDNTFLAVVDAFMPVPERSVALWWSGSSLKSLPYGYLIGIALLLFSLISLMHDRRGLTIYASSAFLLLLFLFLKTNQHIRHEGFIYIAWLFALWISWAGRAKKHKLLHRQSLVNGFIAVVIIASIIGGIRAVHISYAFPFSNSQMMAPYVASVPPADPVLAYPGWATSAIAPYLSSKFKFICLETMAPCTYVIWTHVYDYGAVDSSSIREKVLAFQAAHPGQRHYLFFKDSGMLSDAGLDDQYRSYASLSHDCISGTCSYYMYVYDPHMASTTPKTRRTSKK